MIDSGSDVQVLAGRGPLVAVYPAASTFGPRTADSHQLEWMIAGSCTWTCCERTVDLRPGELPLVRVGMHDYFQWAADRTSRHGYVHFALSDRLEHGWPTWPLLRSTTGPGNGPVAALELIRLARAEPLIVRSNLSFTAVARACGNTDAFHLSRRFRAVYGLPPQLFNAVGLDGVDSPAVRRDLGLLLQLLRRP